jgi:uncharacterized protein
VWYCWLPSVRWFVLPCACALWACVPAAPVAVLPSSYAGPIIDTHFHLEPGVGSSSLQETLTALDQTRAHGGVATAGLIIIAHQGDLEFTRSENDRVAELARVGGGRFFAFGSVHPDDGDAAIAELERIAALGVRGLKLHPNTQRFDLAAPQVERVVKRAAELGLVLLFDAYSPFDADETGKFVKLALAHPTARFILAHMGGPRFFEMVVFSILKAYPNVYKRNVWLELSAVSHLVAGSPSLTEQLRHTCRLVGVDRILFGSDYPVVAPEQAVADVHALGFDASEERRIFHDNAAALFGLPSEPP